MPKTMDFLKIIKFQAMKNVLRYKAIISPLTFCIALCSTGILRAKLQICVSQRLRPASRLGGINDRFVDVELECTTFSSFKFVGPPT